MSCFSKKEEPSGEPLVDQVKELRIILVGKVGVGKSSSGNTILGKEAFKFKSSPNAVTERCQKADDNPSGKQKLVVVDTPGLLQSKKSDKELIREIKKSIKEASPGPHVFLIVLKAGEVYTRPEMDMVKIIHETFGEKVFDHALVLFTWGNELEKGGTSIDEFIETEPRLTSLVEQCGKRYQVFENKGEEKQQQVQELLQKINERAKEGYYTPKMLKEAEADLRKKVQDNAEMYSFKTKLAIVQIAVIFGIFAGSLTGFLLCNGEMTPTAGAVVGGAGGGLLGIGLATLILFAKKKIRCRCPC